MYTDDEMLMLSGIQHYMFCPRQWALIHIEQQWAENRLTAEGNILHENVDNPFYRQKNGDVITLRSVPVASKTLGLYGITDAVELMPIHRPTPSPILNIPDSGNHIPWSTKEDIASPTRETKCSWRHRRCAWRKCMA